MLYSEKWSHSSWVQALLHPKSAQKPASGMAQHVV